MLSEKYDDYIFFSVSCLHTSGLSLFHWQSLTFTGWKWQPVQFGVAEELNISGITESNAMCLNALSQIEKSYSERQGDPGSSTRGGSLLNGYVFTYQIRDSFNSPFDHK